MKRAISTQHFRMFTFLLIAIALPLTIFVIQRQQDIRQRAQAVPIEFLISSSLPKAMPGDTFSLAIDVNTQHSPISAVQVNLTYPVHKLSLTNIDATTSDFDIQSEQVTGNGLIQLRREVSTPTSGQKHVVKIYFTAKEETHPEEINVVYNSTVLRSTDNTQVTARSRLVELSETSAKQEGAKGPTFIDKLLETNVNFWQWLLKKLPFLNTVK